MSRHASLGLALVAVVALAGCAESDLVGLDRSGPTRIDRAAPFQALYAAEVPAAAPRAPTYSIVGITDPALRITRPGTLLCPFRIESAELRAGDLVVVLRDGGPPTSDLRRVGCGFDGELTVPLPDQVSVPVRSVLFEKDGATVVRVAPSGGRRAGGRVLARAGRTICQRGA